jgi:Cd2+/Zn2+-exporting ATPase
MKYCERSGNESSVVAAKIPFLLKVKLTNMVFSAMLLIMGMIYKYVFPENAHVGDLMMGISSLIVSVPVVIYGIRGFFASHPCYVTEQLVSIAVLASMAQRDFISATLIPIFMVIAHFLEEKSILGVREAIQGLKKLYSKKVRRLSDDGEEEEVDMDDINDGDVIICYPGENISVDGIVIRGESLVDQASITGESLPVFVEDSSRVYAGTVNLTGLIQIKITDTRKDSVIERVMSLLEEVEESRTPVEKIVERYIGFYLPFIIAIAAVTLFITGNISRAVTVLIISCPCALILATPTAMIAALVTATRNGIMIKNSSFLELLSEIKTLIFDKTGTITTGSLSLVELDPLEEGGEDELLMAASVCALGSRHPVSRAVIEYARQRSVKLATPDSVEEFSGRGVSAVAGGVQYSLGRKSWIFPEDEKNSEDETVISVWVKKDERVLGRISFSDTLKPGIINVISQCRDIGIEKIVLLTGDKKHIACEIGEAVGVDEIHSECLPEDKLSFVRKCRTDDNKVMTVGDGINDALALSASDIGVTIGQSSSDIAIQSSDITLKIDDLDRIPEMFRLSSRTRGVVNQNILIGAGFSVFMMILAVSGIVNPLMGALFHNLGSIFVIINSSRLLK